MASRRRHDFSHTKSQRRLGEINRRSTSFKSKSQKDLRRLSSRTIWLEFKFWNFGGKISFYRILFVSCFFFVVRSLLGWTKPSSGRSVIEALSLSGEKRENFWPMNCALWWPLGLFIAVRATGGPPSVGQWVVGLGCVARCSLPFINKLQGPIVSRLLFMGAKNNT